MFYFSDYYSIAQTENSTNPAWDENFKLDNHCELNSATWIFPFFPESDEVDIRFTEQLEVQE